MSLQPGSRLGSYEILAAIGAGGMGEVYRARDTRLNRDVALKVLPEALASDPDRLARFQREAHVLAALNHPNIAHVYDFDSQPLRRSVLDTREGNGPSASDVGVGPQASFLVMELVEGPTLADIIDGSGLMAQGSGGLSRPEPSAVRPRPAGLPLSDALHIARQIAEALEAAHEQGIIHRDLKPANIKIRDDGTVKVLDFGLAKLIDPRVSGVSSNPSVTASPTITTPAMMTGVGMILGTAAYMSPEQAKGRPADKRSDVWAFGLVVFEMLAGTRAFDGDDIVDVLGAVARLEPRWAALPPTTPRPIRLLLERCLAKNPKERLGDIAGALFVLRNLDSLAAPDEIPAPRPPALGYWKLAVTVAALAGLAVGGVVAGRLSRSAIGGTGVTRVSVALPPGDELTTAFMDGPLFALSPDGQTLVYVATHESQRQLFVRRLDETMVRSLPGTDGARAPFFSPDGQWIGFFAQGKLKKVAVAGGGAQTLADAIFGEGGAWAEDGTIYFSPSTYDPILRVPATGGPVTKATALNSAKGETTHRWPQILPGGRALLFSVRSGPGNDEKWVEAQILQSGERRVLVQRGDTAHFVSPGYLVYAEPGADALWAVPFNVDRLEVGAGAPVKLTDRARHGQEGAQFDVSENGTLALVSGSDRRWQRQLVWVDRAGHVEALPAPLRTYRQVSLSPDARFVAAETAGDRNEIWLYDLARKTISKLETGGSSQSPIWSPDGARVAYRLSAGGSRVAAWSSIENVGREEKLTVGEIMETPGSFSPDGRLLLFSRNSDLWATATNDPSTARVLVASKGVQVTPKLSPDGRWLAYASNESGREEVFIQPFPALDRKWQVSTEGGIEPCWARNGQELFFRNGDAIMAVRLTYQPVFASSAPQKLFAGHGEATGTNTTGYDVAPDGQRFLMAEPLEPPRPLTSVEIVLNWDQELKRLVPNR